MKFFRKAISVLLAVAITVTMNVTAFAASIALPENEAMKVVAALGTGWNLGNAFDSSDCDAWISNELDYESGWCGAKTTKALIEKIADIGFQSIRIPVSWHNHVDSSYTISTAWINRVQEVVDWCLEEDLFVILNVHHDVSTSYYYPSSTYYSNSEKYLTTVWAQIAEKFKNYDNRLIFETINEPRLTGHTNEWWFDMNNVPADITDSINCINKLNQAALDTIRESGGNNSDRFILVPGYDTSVDGITISGFEMPEDTVDNRLIANFHLYTLDESLYKSIMDRVYNTYTKNGIPAILSEYNQDASNSNNYTDSSASYLSGMVDYARERGISCVIWDNNAVEYKLIDRATATWVHEDIAKAIVEAGKSEISLKLNAPAVAGSSFTEASATITWKASDGAESYSVYRASSLNGTKTKLASNITSLSYTDKTVSGGNTYYYFVTAYDEGFSTESDYSAPSIVTISYTLTPPKTVTAAAGNNSVKISWSAVSGATKYRLQRSTGSSWTTIVYPTATSYTDTSVTAGTTYKYRVLAYVGGSWSDPSSVVTAVPYTTVPRNVKAVPGNNSVKVSWSAVNGATKYRLQRTTGSSWSTIVYPTATSYTDTSVTNGTTYKYRVLAFVDGAWTSASSAVSATPFNTTPTGVTATPDSKQIKITWTAVSGATKYRLQRNSGSGWTTIVYPTATSYTDTSVTAGTTYKYRVLAYVNGAWSAPSSAVSTALTSPVPTGLKAAARDSRVTVSWTAVNGATKYRLQRNSGSGWSTIVYPTATSYVDTSVTNGTTYKYRVLAYVNGAWSSPSSAVSATPTSAVPQNVSVVNGDGKVTVSWSAVSGATKYRLQRTTGSSWTTIVYPSATSYTDTDVTNGTTYKYRVLAYVNGAWSTPSDPATATPNEKSISWSAGNDFSSSLLVGTSRVFKFKIAYGESLDDFDVYISHPDVFNYEVAYTYASDGIDCLIIFTALSEGTAEVVIIISDNSAKYIDMTITSVKE